MKKLILITSILTFALSNRVNAQSGTCFIQISPMDTTICPGDSVFITAIANLLDSGNYFNFNGAILPPGWSTTGGTQFTSPCGPSLSGTAYYWASTTTTGSYPGITTTAYDVTCGGNIVFDMIYAVQSGPSPCEGPDQYNEGVSLQYSLNGGLTWIDIVYYAPNGAILPSNPGATTPGASGATPFTVWNTFSVPIPPGALSTNTSFRWTTQSTSGSCCDNWGLDDIYINASGTPCGQTTIVNWSTGLTDTTSFWITLSTDTNFVALVYDTLGNLQCVSDTVSINVYDGNFNFLLPATANVYCPNSATTVGVSSIVGANLPVSYLWSNAASSTTASASISGQGVTPAAIWYYVDVTDQCGFVQTDSVLLNVNQTLSINSIPTNPQINCASNGTATAIVSGNQGAINYQWFNANGNQISSSSSTTNNAAGWFYVTVTDNVCSTSDSVQILQQLVPFTFTLQDTFTLNCPNGYVNAPIQALVNASGATFTWMDATMTPLGAPAPNNNLSVAQLHANGVAPDLLKFYVLVSSCGSTILDSTFLKVTNINNISFIAPDTLTVFCPFDSIVAQVTNLTGAQNPVNYSWSNGTNGSTAFSTYLNSSGAEQGNSLFTVTVTDACGFDRTKNIILVTDKQLNITGMQAVPSTTCQPDGSVVAFTSGVNGAPPTGTPANFWQDSLSYVNLPNGDSITASSWNNIGSGWYYFTVTDARCFDTDSIYVDQINPPIASFTANQTGGCAGMTVLFANNSQNTTYFEWDFGNGNTATDNTLAAHSEQYYTSGTVTLTAYLDASKTCSNSTTIYIDIVPCGCTDPNALNYDPNALIETGSCIYPLPVVIDPNVFTPNGDGENDLFFFKTEYTVEFKLTITNRWGNVVYDKILDLTAPIGPQGWDGKTQNGNEAKSGTYFYKYTAIGINRDELNGKGFVQLVRE